jgi:hypothetical protein
MNSKRNTHDINMLRSLAVLRQVKKSGSLEVTISKNKYAETEVE